MNFADALRQLRRSEVQWTLVPVLAAAGLSFVPGFGVLSFYFCLPMGLLLAMAAGSVVITSMSHERASGGNPGRGLQRGLVHAALLPAGPLLVITVAHFVNGPCDYWFGLGHFAAGPMMSSLTGAGVAAACSLALKRERNASAAFIVIFAGSFIPNAITMYFDPSVRFYNLFLGLYPGPIYDELIEVTAPFVMFRAWSLTAVAALCLTMAIVFNGGRGWAAPRGPMWRASVWIPAAALWIASGLLWQGAGAFDFTVGRDDIRRELSITRTDSRCTILADSSYAGHTENVDLLLKDCSFRHSQMAAFFGVPDSPRIRVFLYRDAGQKARLIGARWVEISKPWLNEIHVTDMKPGDMILGHEIAHVTAGRHADNMLAMPLSGGLIPDMGMIEGLAVAGAFADEGPSPHEWAMAMIAAGIDPGVESLFSPLSFITGGAAASYNTAGSFIRYIHDTFGSRATAMLAAGGSFEDATGRTVEALGAQWRDFLRQNYSSTSDEAMQRRAAARFSDPGVLRRQCPLDVARMLRDALVAWETGDFAGALDAVRRASCTDPGDRSLKRLAARMEFISDSVDLGTVSATIEDVLKSPEGAATMADRTAAADLMLLWALGYPDDPRSPDYLERARGELRDLLAMLTRGAALRSVCARLWAIEAPPDAGLAVISALSDPRPWTEGDADALKSESGRHPEVAVLQYLAAKASFREGRWDDAVTLFQASLAAGFFEPIGSPLDGDDDCVSEFTAETWKLLGISSYWAADRGTAIGAFNKALDLARFQGDQMLIDEYLSRLR